MSSRKSYGIEGDAESLVEFKSPKLEPERYARGKSEEFESFSFIEYFRSENRVYRILRRVGSGNSADVYEALDWGNNVVALKIYRRSDKTIIEEIGKIRIITEKLGDIPYIVKVFDVGIGDLRGEKKPFIAMDYYPFNLNMIIRRGVDLKESIKIMVKIAKLLTYTSSVGVYHGDLKPSNILIKEINGRLYPAVSDWGGGYTPCYAAPEVYESNGIVVDEKSDVWSFGVILYEIITQSRLFRDTKEYSERIKNDVRVSVPHYPELEELINKCLLRNPENRPSLLEIVSFLEKFLNERLGTAVSKKSLMKLLKN